MRRIAGGRVWQSEEGGGVTRETSAGNLHVECLKDFATLCGPRNDPECAIHTEFGVTNKF